ncbi:protein kinase domain-containing protein [Chamaesiphon sp. VAR_69_metabat_338]|uniref:serine/threonine protein kinase n=1 Tax=Chamaesiphon sp. VAR_69_metabat_338 TaxID=2964704 RepID=UPI00286DDEF4|nr:protein kinase [Chamaesiphon sp. VAR_69_metabat_338]
MLPLAPDTLLQQRYRILNLLDDGGSGRIYLATVDEAVPLEHRERGETECAIEEIVPSDRFPTVVAKAKELFDREVKLLERLQHSQLPRFWGTFTERDRLFLVRDYIAGSTYAQLLNERRDLNTAFSESEVWQFLTQILPAIGYLHSQGVVHRNLAPRNIICRDRDRLPVPISLGVVQEFADKLQADPSNQSRAIGQPDYAPPEQLQHGQVYPHSDLYALAVTAIVLLTGKEPSALFENHLPNWEWRKWTTINDDFANVLGRMLSLDPGDRYQSAVEVNRTLQSLDIPAIRPPQLEPTPQHPSTIPTVAVGAPSQPAAPEERSAITNLGKSIWEQPRVFIPAGLLISLVAGLGSWFGVSQLLHRPATDPVATTPPKQIDFNNPTIPTDASSPSPNAGGDLIQPELNRSVIKEGTVDANTPIKYRLTAVAGQNLDIQLVPAASPTTDPNQPLAANDPARTTPNPVAPIDASPTPAQTPSTTNPPVSIPSAVSNNQQQVLMTILSPAGAAIDKQAERVVGWRGQVPTDGEYTIELRPIKGLTGNAFPYKLSVTQLAVAPSPSPTTEPTPSSATSPTPAANPSPGSTPPLGIPTPGQSGTDGSSTSPQSTPPSTDSSIGAPATPVPIVVPTTPTQSERPTRTRRRRTQTQEASPAVKERSTESTEETPAQRRRRRRVEANNDETPTRRRRVESNDDETPTRRRRVESNDDETPTPRRRRRVESNNDETPTPRRTRQTDTEQTKPSATPKPDGESNKSTNTPQPEPSIGIPVPPAKTTTPNRTEGKQSAPNPGRGDVDPD